MKNFSLLLTLSLGIKIASIALGLYTNRWLNNLDASVFAQYNQISALNTIVLAIILFGIPGFIQKIYTQNHTENYRTQVWSIFILIRLATYFLGIILLFLSLPFTAINDWGLTISLYSVQFLLVIDLHFRSVADAFGKSWWFSLTDFLVKFLIVGILIGMQYLSYSLSLLIFLWAIGISYTVGLIIDYLLFKKYVRFTLNIDIDVVKKITKPLFYLTLTAFIVSFYSGIDILVLGRLGFSSESINGYSNAYKIFTLLLIIPSMLIPPLASYVHKTFLQKNAEPYLKSILNKIFPKLSIGKKIITEWTLFSFLFGIIAAIFIYFLGRFVILLIDPQLNYPEAIPSLSILSIGFAVVFPTSFLANLLIFFDGEKTEFVGILFVTIFAILAYTLFIPSFGSVGAAIATSTYLVIDFIIKVTSFLRFVKLEKFAELSQKDQN